MRRSPLDVIPEPVADAVADGPHWFVIGGQAVRCLCPYRPSHDVDFGVSTARNANELLDHLKARGNVVILETGKDTTHLTFDGIDVSVFVLKRLAPHVEEGALRVEALLATKLHAILDRGTRRDFFDLYVLMQLHSFGLLDCINALQEVYETEINQGLLLRALAYFEDADEEPALPGEGPNDWERIRRYLRTAVAALLVPPQVALAIQANVVDVRTARRKKAETRTPARKVSPRPRRAKAR
jgi:hypothetical protein